MLGLAINHLSELQDRYRATLFDERYKFYQRTPGFEYFIPLANNCSDGVQFVSMNCNGEVIGYLSAKFNRLTRTAYDLEAIKFIPDRDLCFSQDMGAFDIKLFNEFGMNRLVWSVVVGNPAEKFYDSLTEICGVRIVGTFRDEVMLSDGRLYDLKYYEVLKEDFFAAVDLHGATVFNYRDIGKEVGSNG